MKPPHFCPQKPSFNGPVQYVKDRESKCFTSDEARYIYKKDDLVHLETIKQEEDRLDNNNELEEQNLIRI